MLLFPNAMSHPREAWESRVLSGANSYVRVPYPDALAALGQALFRDAAVRAIQRRLSRNRIDLAVDLGAGVGDWAIRYAGFSRCVFAVDVNAAFVAEGRSQAERRALSHVHFHRGDVATVDVPSGAELVSVGSVFQYLRDDEIC